MALISFILYEISQLILLYLYHMKVLMSSPQCFDHFVLLSCSILPADKLEVIPQQLRSASAPISERHCNSFDIDSLNKTSKCNMHINITLNNGEKMLFLMN